MQLLAAQGEALPDGHHHFGQQRRSVGVEEPIERPADAVIADVGHLVTGDAEAAGGELMHRLALAVDRLALDDERAQQHPQGGGVRQDGAPIGGGNVLGEQRREAQPLEEVIDQG